MIDKSIRFAIFFAGALQCAGTQHANCDEQGVRIPVAASPPITQHAKSEPSPTTLSPTTLATCLTVPAEYSANFGAYRSPLLFNDGSIVQSASDWLRRRQEILDSWTKVMGPWPEVILHPSTEILSSQQRGECLQQRIRLQVGVNEWTEGWLVTPSGAGPFPAVLVLYYDPNVSIGSNPQIPQRDYGWQLAQRGFVTLSIGGPGSDYWASIAHPSTCQPLSYLAYIAANCWQVLDDCANVDESRIGVVGHSYGGKWSMFAGALCDKFACIAVSDPGIVFDESRGSVNYWEPWYLGFDREAMRCPGPPLEDNPRTGAYAKLIEQGHDLHEIHALIAPRPFFVSGGTEDPPERWTALNHLIAVNHRLGFENRVGMANRADHAPTEQSNSLLFEFFDRFLKAK
ncbi:MAG: sialidase [Planctomycetota bacterium]|nr:sialidase [Planctomycetota bacterium]MDA1179299.1 sialidase [Planctomycetota bacterium]